VPTASPPEAQTDRLNAACTPSLRERVKRVAVAHHSSEPAAIRFLIERGLESWDGRTAETKVAS